MSSLNRAIRRTTFRHQAQPASDAVQQQDGASENAARGWVRALRLPTNRAAFWEWPAMTTSLLSLPDSPVQAIADQILDTMTRCQHQSLAVVGSSPGAGCSTLTVALARCLAARQPVLIVDGDLSQPQLAEQLQLSKPACGLWEVLCDGAPLSSAILTLDSEAVRILPLISSVPDDQVEACWPALQRLLAILPCLDEYSLVLIDAGVRRPNLFWSSLAVQSMLQVVRRSDAADDVLSSACVTAGIGLLGIVETNL